MENITIVTTCMQRLAFLRRSLPTWIERTRFDVVVVDASCPEGSGAWAESAFGGRVTVVRHAVERREGRAVFNPSKARNAGAAAVREGHVLFLDADVEVMPGFEEWVEGHLGGRKYLAVAGRPSPLFGFLGVHVDAFREAGGFDEGFTGWGGEDLELRLRLHLLGLDCDPIPETLLFSLPHSNDLRSKNSEQPDFNKACQVNELYLHRKVMKMTGRRFRAWADALGVDLARPGTPSTMPT